ncbi:MAG TPA: phage portal protein [Actinophytocola sp.]|jgi:HK97 family phage major capsid protein|nr:phage portal protein [Actinophytocola sp.]
MAGLLADGAIAPRVSRAQAMSVPAVKRGRDLICGTLGTLRIKNHDARRRVVPSELLDQPETDVARSVTMTKTVEDMLFEGRAWWRITEFGMDGFPAKIVRLDPRTVTIRENARVYVSSETGVTQGQSCYFVPDAELIRIDSPNDALLEAGARAIRQALALERTAARYADEPLPLGFFTPADGFADQEDGEIEEMLDNWEDARARRAWGYVGAALKAEKLQWNAEELQLGTSRDYAVLEIARLIGVDPEELGVSTTSRTYQNAEQRRLDLIDFTLAAYVTAIEDRLSMGDVTPPGYYVRAEYGGFLRSDTETRMRTYKVGREVGVYNDERIGELEDIPTDQVRVAREASALPQQPPAAQPAQSSPSEETTVQQSAAPTLAFTAPIEDTVHVGFAMSDVDAEFRVNAERRTVTGIAVPWNVVARSSGAKWMFAPDSLHWTNERRIKLDDNHRTGTEVGYAARLQNTRVGLDSSFKIARGDDGNRILSLAEDGVYDGLSVDINFASEGDGWTAHPNDDTVRLVHSATLRKVAITATPAFDDARVVSVAATREEVPPMDKCATCGKEHAPNVACSTGAAAASAPFDVAAFTAGLTEAMTTAVTAAVQSIQVPQADPNAAPTRQIVPAGRVEVTREAPVYTMSGTGPSFVRDAWRARTENDLEARERLSKYQKQTADFAQRANDALMFAADTGSAAAVIPPGYRPELYVTQLMQGRPLVDAVSRGSLTDATPFTLPKFTSSSGMTADHVEGVNPTDGTMVIDTITVTPGGISGLFELTREIVDSANPAIDAIAMQAMQESYSQQTEAKVYAELNGVNGQSGTITSGFVPSGAQVATTSGQGDELIAGVRAALALYPFRRFAAPNRALLSQEGTSGFATAVGSDGRPLLPSIGAQNTAGLGNAVTQGWFVDGLPFQPAWSMTGNASGDADVLAFNSNDVWAWESSLLTFRFEERGGPARIDLALFGYFATRLLRPVGLTAIRHTAS